LPTAPLDEHACRRAEEVQDRLASRGHRGPRPVDLLIAAIAEVNELSLLHYDRHFDLIVEVTGQAAEWLAPRGTLD
jgi:predicted nucleic acid-binding protein